MLANSLMFFVSAIPILLGAIFLHAGLSKLASDNQPYYEQAIEAYGLTPKALSPFLPKLIGFSEVVVAVLLLLCVFNGATKSIALILAGSIFSVYFLAIAKQIMQGNADMNCGCAGPGAELKVSPMVLLRNALLVSLCVVAFVSKSAVFVDVWIMLMPMALILILIYLSGDQLIANQQKIQLLRNL